jgi:membrane-associated phospholipid phosphatase
MRRGWLRRTLDEANRLDLSVYRAVAKTRTPALDEALARLSRAADYSRISVSIAAVLAAVGGPTGRRAAGRGIASIVVTATVVNAVFKPLTRRRRPGRIVHASPLIRMPRSRSFPSGHTAAAFAFATGVAHELPAAGPPLYALAGLVGYSRVHTGVHFPLDVLVGAVSGMALAEVTNAWIDRNVVSASGAPGALRDVDEAPEDQERPEDQRGP